MYVYICVYRNEAPINTDVIAFDDTIYLSWVLFSSISFKVLEICAVAATNWDFFKDLARSYHRYEINVYIYD